MSWNVHTMICRLGGVLALAVLATGCSIDKSTPPAVSAPSSLGMSVTYVASPDTLPRDGQSTSLVRLFARDFQDQALAGQRFALTVSTGTLSASDVTTDSTGTATVRFTAPAASTDVTSATISATPVAAVGTATSATRSIVIALTGPSVPSASFSWTPITPGQYDIVTFDASATTLDGASCLETCTYAWDFGDGISSSGRIAAHRFQSSATYSVKLTVTGPGGIVVTSNRTVVIGAAAAITAVITQSPTDAKVNDVVIFDGSSSTSPDGTAIVSYTWDFGNGSTASSRSATTTYTVARTYTVRLTIVDALGRTATTTRTVTVG